MNVILNLGTVENKPQHDQGALLVSQTSKQVLCKQRCGLPDLCLKEHKTKKIKQNKTKTQTTTSHKSLSILQPGNRINSAHLEITATSSLAEQPFRGKLLTINKNLGQREGEVVP